MKALRFFVAVLFVGLLMIGCGRKTTYVATPVTVTPVRIVVGRATADSSRHYVEAQVTNTGDKPMTIDRNGVALVLEDGQVLGRSIGVTSLKKPYQVEPGRTHAVHVDFKAEDFRWKDVRKAKIDWSAAIIVDGKNVPIEPMTLVARPTEEGEWEQH
jgi:hypothetical protein